MATNITRSNLEGFFEGYKERNLSTNKFTFDFHTGEIIRLIEQLKHQLNDVDNNNGALLAELNKGAGYLTQNIDTKDSAVYYENALSFGKCFNAFLDFNLAFLSETQRNVVKKIIYHFLNLAQKLEGDEHIEKEAREIAQKFENNPNL